MTLISKLISVIRCSEFRCRTVFWLTLNFILDAMTRKDLDSSSGSTEKPAPASERLRQYLKGLEKKLENVTTMIDYSSSSHRSEKRLPHTESNGNYPAKRLQFITLLGYVSDRWRAYYGTDFKYIPAKKELDDRAANDYRYFISALLPKSFIFSYKTREIVRTSSY